MVAAARQLFGSLRRFGTLPDYLQVWPGHGAGSACGKSLGAVPQSTLGYEKLANWAFAIEDEEEFVRAALEGQPEPPRYFGMMKQINRDGPPLLGPARSPDRLPGDRLARALADRGIVIDTRPALDYAQGAIPGTINLPWNRSFTTWAGSVLPYDRDLYLIADEAAGTIARELSGIGLDRVAGCFGVDVVEARRRSEEPLVTVPTIDAAALQRERREVAVLDVRHPAEFLAGHLPGAMNIPLGDLPARMAEVPRERPLVVHCQSGARAAIAASLLLADGACDVRVLPGGFAEWQASGREVE